MRLHRRVSRTGSIVTLIALGSLTQISGAGPAAADLASPHMVSQAHAEGLIARFRATAAPDAVRSHYFDRSIFDLLLAQPGASGIRIHHGAYPDGRDALVLTATDRNADDIDGGSGNSSLPSPPYFTDPGDPSTPMAKIPPARLNHAITREHAESLIARFRASAAPGAVRSHFFDRSAFDVLLAQPGATGLRVHYGTYADGREALVLYATDKTGRQLPQAANLSAPCPNSCDDVPGTTPE